METLRKNQKKIKNSVMETSNVFNELISILDENKSRIRDLEDMLIEISQAERQM